MRLFKVAEVGSLTGSSERSVHRWIESGRLRAVKLGGSTRIREVDFDAFIAAAPSRAAADKNPSVGGGEGVPND